MRAKLLGLMSAALLIVSWGCGSGAPPVDTTTQEATVSGTATFKGKPITRGTVTFDPSNYQRQVASKSASIEKDGRYTITTLVGENRVSASSPQIPQSREMDDIDHYFNVQPGSNTYDIVLPPATDAPPAGGR